MSFIYYRTVRFQDTDAAGVVYFANILVICHEAYEESLATSGTNLKSFFSNQAVAIPIVHTSVDFFRPVFCGDRLLISLIPQYLSEHKFQINYQVMTEPGQVVAQAVTKHTCIDPVNRTRKELPAEIVLWLQQWSEKT